MRRLGIATTAIAASLIVVIAIAVVAMFALLTAAPNSIAGDDELAARPLSPDLPAEAIGALRRELTQADRAEHSRVAKMFEGAPGTFGSIDFELARPIAVTGSAMRGWVAPTGDGGKVCLILPDPVDGFGAGCSTAEDIAEGRAVVVLDGGPGGIPTSTVAALVPTGSAAPVLIAPDGEVSAMKPFANVAATVVSGRYKVRSAAGTVNLNFPRAASVIDCAVDTDCAGK